MTQIALEKPDYNSKQKVGIPDKILCSISLLLRCIWLFFPGILLILLSIFAFWSLSQGKDVILFCLEGRQARGWVLLVALIFWAFVTWYSGRLVAHNHETLGQARVAGTDIPLGKILLDHMPRFLGFYAFAVIILALWCYQDEHVNSGLAVGELVLYVLLSLLFNRIRRPIKRKLKEVDEGAATLNEAMNGCRRLSLFRRIAWIIAAVCLLLASLLWSPRQVVPIAIALTLIQVSFLFLVVTRRTAGNCRLLFANEPPLHRGFWDDLLILVMGSAQLDEDNYDAEEILKRKDEIRVERLVFKLLNGIAVIAIPIYLGAICSLHIARLVSPMPFALLAFGVLIGFSNLISLMSHRRQINFHFVFLFIVFLVGLWVEPHWVSTSSLSTETGELVFRKRVGLKTYLTRWMSNPVRSGHLTNSDSAGYPVFIVLADGGASRSGYWTASVLGHLDSATTNGKFPFREHLFCLSGASGGSVGNGSYFAALAENLRGDTIRQAATHFLSHDFLSFTLARMLGPDLVAPLFDWFAGDRAWALEHSMEKTGDATLDRAVSRGFSNYLPYVKDALPNVRNALPIIFINTTRMQDGRPGVVSNIDIDSIANGNRIDVLDSLAGGEDIHLSTCMVMGARFPYVSPAGRIRNQYFVDGGYFDNSGAGIVHEMLQEIEHLKQDTAFVNGTMIRKLRFYVLHITNTPFSISAPESVHPFKNDLLAPLVTLAGSYSTQTDVNDYRLNNYIDKYNRDSSHLIINLYREKKEQSFPMNWVISSRMLDSMQVRTKQAALDTIIQRLRNGNPNVFKGLREKSYPM
jgi:hypothetical protein